MARQAPKAFTGWHITAILVAFFGVVIAVNVYMAHQASATFGGVVVENSYVASQHYNKWLDEAAKEKALGWTALAKRGTDGFVHVTLQGVPAGATLSAIARHPLGRMPDRAMAFQQGPDGAFVSRAPLPEGRWRLRLEIAANGSRWRSEEDI